MREETVTVGATVRHPGADGNDGAEIFGSNQPRRTCSDGGVPRRRRGCTPSRRLAALLLLLAPFLAGVKAQQSEGDSCSTDHGEFGVCRPLKRCQRATEQLTQGIRPKICSFDLNIPIVCCVAGARPPMRPNPNRPGNQRPLNWSDFTTKPSNPPGQGGRRPKPTQTHGGGSRPTQTHGGGSRPTQTHGGGSRPRRKISEKMCEEYSKLVTDRIEALPLVLEPNPVSFSVENCPQTGLQLIVGGERTQPGEFPHMAAIGYQRSNSPGFDWDCGGSLISEFFVLTAAHCTLSSKGQPAAVRIGELSLRRDEPGGELFQPPGYSNSKERVSSGDYMIQKIIRHPRYHPPAKYNDIALLRLEKPVNPFTPLVRPACLYTKPTFNVNRTTATGWGRIDFAESPSDILLKVGLKVIDTNTCNKLYASDRKTNKLSQGIVPSMMCAGELAGGKDTCQGDSGGPIQIQSSSNRCVHYVIGVTSFGKYCAAPNTPGVYTRVSFYVPWIERIVWSSG